MSHNSLTASQAPIDPAYLQTGTMLSKLAECIGDTDKAVRAALKELLSKVILPQLKGDMLGPFVPLVMAHLFSALTSLSEPVRSAPFCDTFCGATDRNHIPLIQSPCAIVVGVCSLCLWYVCWLLSTSMHCRTRHNKQQCVDQPRFVACTPASV